MNGASRAGMMTFASDAAPDHGVRADAAIIAPTTPPISACEDDDGMLKNQVTRFQRIAPTSPANTIGTVTSVLIDDPARDRRGDGDRDERAHEVEDRREPDRDPRRQRTRGDGRRHRVRGVMEAVREIEDDSRRDRQRNHPEAHVN